MLDLEAELARLFHPVPPRTVFARYWERRPLLIRGARDKFAGLDFSSAVFYATGRDAAHSQVCKAWIDMEREIAIDPRSIQRHYRAGRSICMSNVQLRHEPLRQVVAALKAVLGLAHEIGFAGYLSPTQQGIPLHCDRHEVFILQIEGEKEWRYARGPSVAFPLAATQPANAASVDQFLAIHAGDDPRIPQPRDLVRTVLRPGDLLYMPAGTFHATHADKHSLSLSLGCAPRSIGSIIGDTIERAFRHRSEWRRNPPPIAQSPAGAAQIEQLLRPRLRDLSQWLAGADVDRFASVWRSHLSDFRWDPPSAPPSDAVGPDTRLARVWPITTSSARRNGPLEVLAANRVFSVPRRHRRLIGGLAAHARFSADDARRWGRCSWPTAKAFVELMLQHGIVALA